MSKNIIRLGKQIDASLDLIIAIQYRDRFSCPCFEVIKWNLLSAKMALKLHGKNIHTLPDIDKIK